MRFNRLLTLRGVELRWLDAIDAPSVLRDCLPSSDAENWYGLLEDVSLDPIFSLSVSCLLRFPFPHVLLIARDVL